MHIQTKRVCHGHEFLSELGKNKLSRYDKRTIIVLHYFAV